MKRNLLKLFTLLLTLPIATSCSEDSESTTKSYQIVNNSSYYSSSIDYLDGTLYEVVVFQYYGDDVISQDNLPDISYGGGKSSVIEADSRCEKVQVSYKMLPPESAYYDLSSNYRLYVVANTYLNEGETAIISIDGETMVSSSRTKSSDSASISQLQLLFE